MSIEENKQNLKRSMDEVWTQGNMDKVNEFYADDLVEHNPYGDIDGIETYRQFVNVIRETYSNLKVTLHNIIADENFVACNYTVEGKHTGQVGDVEPTNKQVSVPGTFLGRMEDGKIAESWNNFDLASLLMQVGSLEQPSFVQEREGQVRGG